ncbi:flagellar basal body rod protein FlgB [Magnetococcales bacterium HHB-1]
MSGFSMLGELGAYKANLLNLRSRRQEIIAANVANADTPGYKARRLEFEDIFKQSLNSPGDLAMAKSNRRHMPEPPGMVSGSMQAVETPIPKGDRNSVDLEQEMARQTANQLLYNYAAQSLSGQIGKMKMILDASK